MCFSATASFTAAGVIATIGALTLRIAHTSKHRLLAVIPLLFAFQQMMEGVVWVTISHGYRHSLLHTLSVYLFLFFAGIVWPIFIPALLSRFEENSTRRKFLHINMCVGILLASYSAFVMFTMGPQAQVIEHHIAYPPYPGIYGRYLLGPGEIGYLLVSFLYVLVTVGSAFISSIRYMWILGLLGAFGFIIAQVFYAYAFGSVWCFAAAIISTAIYFIIYRSK